jgi:hypothetical protein
MSVVVSQIVQWSILIMFSVMTERYFKLAKSLAFVIQYLPHILHIKRYKEPQKPFLPLLLVCEFLTVFVYMECFVRFSQFIRPYLSLLTIR